MSRPPRADELQPGDVVIWDGTARTVAATSAHGSAGGHQGSPTVAVTWGGDHAGAAPTSVAANYRFRLPTSTRKGLQR